VKSCKTVGGRFGESKPKSDVEWMIYRASSKPGPGEYDSERSSMVTQNFVRKKGAILQGKVVQGNSRTVIPGNFTMCVVCVFVFFCLFRFFSFCASWCRNPPYVLIFFFFYFFSLT
jgi:hypothetical protein